MSRTLTESERALAAGMIIRNEPTSDIAYRFGITQAAVRELASECYQDVLREVWDLDEPDEHPVLDVMFSVARSPFRSQESMIHLMQGNDANMSEITMPRELFDRVVERIRAADTR